MLLIIIIIMYLYIASIQLTAQERLCNDVAVMNQCAHMECCNTQ